MNIGERGLALIKGFEELRLEAYHGTADPVGVWTIGWGHTKGVAQGHVIDQETAEMLLRQDIADAEEAVANTANMSITTPAQFDAMVSLTFNVGVSNFAKSTLLRKHNAGDFFGAAQEFDRWVYSAGQPRRGLLRRRLQEASLYADDRFIQREYLARTTRRRVSP